MQLEFAQVIQGRIHHFGRRACCRYWEQAGPRRAGPLRYSAGLLLIAPAVQDVAHMAVLGRAEFHATRQAASRRGWP